MTPVHHAMHSAHRWGGPITAYLAVHAWLDQSKAAWSDPRHRAFLHHRQGATMAATLLPSMEGLRSTREVAEDHIREDLGFLPDAREWLVHLRAKSWMAQGTMTAADHAQASARRWGGAPALYLPVHAFLDGDDPSLPLAWARAVLHHGMGIHLAVARFGEILRPSPSILVPVREVLEAHIRLDCGTLPSLVDWYGRLTLMPWMFRGPAADQAVCDLTRQARSRHPATST
jgi:hypothetical protein